MTTVRICCGLLLLMAIAGCGRNPKEISLYRVSGKVLYDGKPVPAGYVNFIPDTKAGNKGPQGSAKIVNGVYDTRAEDGRGIVGGPTVAVISGRLKDAANEYEDQGILFENYEVSIDFPQADAVQDLDVPLVSNAKKSKAGG